MPSTTLRNVRNLLKNFSGYSKQNTEYRLKTIEGDSVIFLWPTEIHLCQKAGKSLRPRIPLRLFEENALAAEQNQAQWVQDDPITILFIKSNLRLVVDLQNCIKAQQSRAYAQKVKISNLQQMAKTVAYIQEHGYDTQEKLQDTTDTIQSKWQSPRRCQAHWSQTEKVNEQIHYLGQYLSTKSVYADFLKSTNKKDFRQNYADEIAKYEEALQFLKQNSQDGKLPTMKDLRS